MSQRIPVVLLGLLLALPLGAGEAPEAVSLALRPLAPLVGISWIATFPNGALTDEQSFEWVYGGRFLRSEHQVRNEAGEVVYEGETIFAWDPKGEQIVWWYWNTTGGYVTGTMTETEEGWISEGENHAPEGQTPKVRGAMRDVGPDSWDSVQFFERDGEWVEQWTMTYRRSPEEPVADTGGRER